MSFVRTIPFQDYQPLSNKLSVFSDIQCFTTGFVAISKIHKQNLTFCFDKSINCCIYIREKSNIALRIIKRDGTESLRIMRKSRLRLDYAYSINSYGTR